MKKAFLSLFGVSSAAELFYGIWTVAVGVLSLFFLFTQRQHAVLGIFFWAAVILGLFVCRPGSVLHRHKLDSSDRKQTVCTILVVILTVAVCILPMAESPLWNGEIPGHRNQYELMAEALLDGRITFDYGDEEALLALENPYDPQERKDAGVSYHWDHAYYEGEYYMYFGIVPVLLVFLPFRLLTGTALTTYHATQLFAAMSIIGIFLLFRLLAKRFLKQLSYGIYIALSIAFSLVCIWFSIAQPALYCTAITSAICMEVWSLYFFIKAVWDTEGENRQILLSAVGALLGALAFGCRPTIALANILVIPMLAAFLKQHKLTPKLFGKLALAALPYVIVAAVLMLYNYVRFDNPLEFGQTYQLTVADQTNLGDLSDPAVRLRLINESFQNFFGFHALTNTFPYISHSSVFVNFPILLFCFGLFRSDVRGLLQKCGLSGFTGCLFALPIVITLLSILWSPYLLERYRMDIYFLICILCFLIIGIRYQQTDSERQAAFGARIMVFALLTILSCFMLHLVSVKTFLPEQLSWIEQAILFWKYL